LNNSIDLKLILEGIMDKELFKILKSIFIALGNFDNTIEVLDKSAEIKLEKILLEENLAVYYK